MWEWGERSAAGSTAAALGAAALWRPGPAAAAATYTGYGKIVGCESHQSKDGYSIGKLSYEEFVYYVVGKTKEEARSAAPKAISDLHTTEIFRWENNKWFY